VLFFVPRVARRALLLERMGVTLMRASTRRASVALVTTEMGCDKKRRKNSFLTWVPGT